MSFSYLTNQALNLHSDFIISNVYLAFFPQISATDADIGSNGDITYTLVTNSAYFSLNRQSGVLSVSRTLNSAAVTVHQLEVRAEDGGTPSRSTAGECLILGQEGWDVECWQRSIDNLLFNSTSNGISLCSLKSEKWKNTL